MNKLLVALLLGALALGSVAAMADDKTPAQPVDPVKLKAEKDAAKADAAAAKAQPKALPGARRQIGVPLDRRYREALPPERPVQRDPARSNP